MKVIYSEKAPAAVGPYSQAIMTNGMIFVSGQLPIKDGVISHDIAQATRNCIENAKAILEQAGSGLHKVVKTTVFMKDLAQFQDMNAVYGQYFSDHKPARSTIQVAGLPLGAIVEIELIALSE